MKHTNIEFIKINILDHLSSFQTSINPLKYSCHFCRKIAGISCNSCQIFLLFFLAGKICWNCRKVVTLLGSRHEGKRGKEGKENTPPKAQQREEEKDFNSSPNGDEPESRPKTERMGAGQERAHL